MPKSTRRPTRAKNRTARNSRATVSGPAAPDNSGTGDALAEKMAGTQDVASAFPFNRIKSAEYHPAAALAPPEGSSVKPADPIVGASTVTELNGSDKVGSGGPTIGQNPTVGPLDRVRVDSTDRVLTTNQGVPIADNQNSLKAGLRGPTLLEDFILREKITTDLSAFRTVVRAQRGQALRVHRHSQYTRPPLRRGGQTGVRALLDGRGRARLDRYPPRTRLRRKFYTEEELDRRERMIFFIRTRFQTCHAKPEPQLPQARSRGPFGTLRADAELPHVDVGDVDRASRAAIG